MHKYIHTQLLCQNKWMYFPISLSNGRSTVEFMFLVGMFQAIIWILIAEVVNKVSPTLLFVFPCDDGFRHHTCTICS